MRHDKTSIINELSTNVPLPGDHIGDSICSHEVGTSVVDEVVYCNGRVQVHQDMDGTYHSEGIKFKIVDGWFISDELNLELPRRTTINTFQRVTLALGMPLNKEDSVDKLNIQDISFRELLHVLTMMSLKDLKAIPNSLTYRKQYDYGINVFEAYYKAVSGSGRIKATQKNLRWLNEKDTKQLKAKLFKTSGYRSGSHSMKYEVTEFAENIMATVYKLIKLLDFQKNEIEYQSLDFVVTVNVLEEIRIRDVMLLLSDCIGYNKGFVVRPRLEDRWYSRVYSVFVSISSNTRKILGFTNYDIGAALQTITLQLVETPSSYPLHLELVNDKRAFRAKIQIETGKDREWVKKELSKIDNMDKLPKRYDKYPTLKAYFDEAQLLREEIIASAESLILSRAKDFAKPKWMEFWNPVKNKFDYVPVGQKESSIFFFIWTQWERQIRESMMSCFSKPTECHQVHDAVYSKQQIDPKIIEEKVLEDTGFVVQISID